KAHGKHRVTYRWLGHSPYLLEKPISWLTEEELISLVAARGFLRDVDPAKAPTVTNPEDCDILAGAISRLVNRAGVQDAAELLARRVVTVSRFGAAPTKCLALAHTLAATAVAEAIEFDYENLQGLRRRIHAVPQRCVLIKGEWYVIAWAGGLKNFRLSRMDKVQRTRQHPEQAPAYISASEVDALLETGFYATGSTKPKDRTRIQLGIAPQAWPHIRDRRWGENQTIEDEPKGLPEGWRRLSFTTTGLAECQHWVLAMGANARAEKPKALVEWVCEQARAMVEACEGR
ncbi:MAG: WYL domain-containing protein, partial [Spiribacter salinus]